MYYENAYKRVTEILNSDVQLPFQRLSIFLIATVFLMAAFGTVLAISTPVMSLVIGCILSVAGFCYSVVLADINYHNTRMIWQIGKGNRELENMAFWEVNPDWKFPFIRAKQIVFDSMKVKATLSLLWNMLVTMCKIARNPAKQARREVADHTYILPAFFSIIWLALLINLLGIYLLGWYW